MHWIHIRGSPDGKTKERTLGEFWEFGEHRSIQKNAESTGRSATIFATILGRFWRSCGGIDSSCVTPAADCGVGVHCLAGSNLPISVISRVMGEGIYIAFY